MNSPAVDVAARAGEPILVCTDVTKSFGGRNGEVRVLRGVSLAVHPGDIVVVTGRTGSGKSTLLHILAGLELPTSGGVVVGGCPLQKLSGAALARLRREKIGIVFQNFNLLPSWAALENVEAALLHTGTSNAARRRRAEALFSQLGLSHRLNNLPSELSVGEQQLVAIARALANKPPLILADEPTGDVDPVTAQGIVGHLTTLAREHGAALIVATHGPFPLTVATRIFRLEHGRLSSEESHDAATARAN